MGPIPWVKLDSEGLELDKSLGKAVLTIKIQWFAMKYNSSLDISLSKVCIL